MGCGHSKINIYPKKSKGKSSSKKSVSSDKADSEEEEGIETEAENLDNADDCGQRKTIKVKPFGGPLLAQVEISTSQQDFFKMLDEKIQNGPDYNSESESEKAAETIRLRSLIKDWETASQGSRSLPSTPKRWTPATARDNTKQVNINQTPITQSVIHQSYGVTATQLPSTANYRQVPYSNQPMMHPYQAMYGAPPPQSYLARQQDNHNRPVITYDQTVGSVRPNRPVDLNNKHPDLPGRPMSNYEQRSNTLPPGSYLARTLENTNRPMTTGFEQRPVQLRSYGGESSPKRQQQEVGGYSPAHRMYGGAVALNKEKTNCDIVYNPGYSNGDLIQQQQLYGHQATQQYPSQKQYMVPHDQVLSQYQQNVLYRDTPKKHHYQNSMSNMPMVAQSQQTEVMNSLNRKQYELT